MWQSQMSRVHESINGGTIMQKGVKGMGMHKHAVSGRSGMNPWAKQQMARDINKEKEHQKKPPKEEMFGSVKELMEKSRKKLKQGT